MSLICEFVTEVHSSTAPLKIRIRNHDDSPIGIDTALYRIAENIATNEYLHLNYFLASFGFPDETFNWDDFWQSNSDFYYTGSESGIVSGRDLSEMPYLHQSGNQILQSNHPFNLTEFEYDNDFNNTLSFNYVPTVNWENGKQGYACIATLPANLADSYTSEIDARAGATTQNSEWGNGQNINYELLDSLKITLSIGFKIISPASGVLPSEISTIEQEEQSFINNLVSDETRYVFKPITFHSTEYVYDMRSLIIDYDMPTFVEEGQENVGSIFIDTLDYAGELQIFAFDKDNIESLNDQIQDEITDWYGQIGEYTIANYGNLQLQNSETNPLTIQVEKEQSGIEIPIRYLANNVDAGQTDIFTVFIKSANPDFSKYGEYAGEAQRQWDFYTGVEKWDYVDTIRIEVLDINTGAVDIYDAGNILIEHPADILHHLIYVECGYKGEIDSLSKDMCKIAHPNWKMGFSVNEQIDAKDLIKEICESTKMIVSFSNNLLKFITIEDTYTGEENIQTINADDVLDYNFTRTPIGDVKTQVEVKYKYDYGLETYNSSTKLFKANEDYFSNTYNITGTYKDYFDNNIENQNYYGLDELDDGSINHENSFITFKSDYIRDEQTASKLAEYLLMQKCNQHNIIEVSLPLKYYSLEVGDLIDFNKMILGRKAYNEKYVLDSPDDMQIRCGQYILPLFMITNVSKDLTGIKIEAMQLHHLSTSDLVWKGNVYPYLESQDNVLLGDINNDGFVDILDVVAIVQYVVNETTLTADNLARADINQDGVVDILDVVGIVQQVTGNVQVASNSPANNVNISYGNGSVEIDNTGEIAAFEMYYRGAIHGVKKLGKGWRVKISDNKIVIFSFGEESIKQELFSYIGDFEITSCRYANWDGSNGYANITSLKSETWDSVAGDFDFDARKYEEIKEEETINRRIKKSII